MWVCALTIGQFLFTSKPTPSIRPPPLCAFASILSVMLTSTLAPRHRTAVGEGKGREGGKGDQGEWMSSGGMRGEDGGGESAGEGGGGRKREEGTARGARLQVWPKSHSWPPPAGGLSFHNHLAISFLLPPFRHRVVWFKSFQSPSALPFPSAGLY